jgi:hypothetical protein
METNPKPKIQKIEWPAVMAGQSYAGQMLDVLRPKYPEYQLWVVHRVGASDVWCAGENGEPTACVNVASPEEVDRAIRQLETQ